jgi:hypothetical protein
MEESASTPSGRYLAAYNARSFLAENALPQFPARERIPTVQFLCASLLACLVLVAGPLAAEEVSKIPTSRSESLELPGLTAGCHVCEWRPKPHQMPAGEQCGADATGVAQVGLFECGFYPDCRRECHFLRCENR